MSQPQQPYGQGPYGYQPQQPYPPQGFQQPPPQPPKRKRRTGRAVLLGVIGLLVVIIVATALSGGGKKPSPAASAPPAAAPATAPPSPAGAAAPVAPRVLIRFDGSGIRNSVPFNVGSGALTVHYSFNCASFGQSGNFQADLLYGNQSSLSSDDQPIANALAMSGSQTTTVYPQDSGKDYYLSVNSECSWKIKVTG